MTRFVTFMGNNGTDDGAHSGGTEDNCCSVTPVLPA